MSRKIDFLKSIIEYTSKTNTFWKHGKETKFLFLNDGRCKAEFAITEDHLNSEGNLHTGLIMTLVDVISSLALTSHEDRFTGVSANIHLSNINPVGPGEVLSINAKLCEITKPLAFLEVELMKKNTDEVVARGQHTLFIKPLNLKIL